MKDRKNDGSVVTTSQHEPQPKSPPDDDLPSYLPPPPLNPVEQAKAGVDDKNQREEQLKLDERLKYEVPHAVTQIISIVDPVNKYISHLEGDKKVAELETKLRCGTIHGKEKQEIAQSYVDLHALLMTIKRECLTIGNKYLTDSGQVSDLKQDSTNQEKSHAFEKIINSSSQAIEKIKAREKVKGAGTELRAIKSVLVAFLQANPPKKIVTDKKSVVPISAPAVGQDQKYLAPVVDLAQANALASELKQIMDTIQRGYLDEKGKKRNSIFSSAPSQEKLKVFDDIEKKCKELKKDEKKSTSDIAGELQKELAKVMQGRKNDDFKSALFQTYCKLDPLKQNNYNPIRSKDNDKFFQFISSYTAHHEYTSQAVKELFDNDKLFPAEIEAIEQIKGIKESRWSGNKDKGDKVFAYIGKIHELIAENCYKTLCYFKDNLKDHVSLGLDNEQLRKYFVSSVKALARMDVNHAYKFLYGDKQVSLQEKLNAVSEDKAGWIFDEIMKPIEAKNKALRK